MKIDMRQLSALVAVIEEQSFERAAARLHLTQSAVSQRIKQLENRFGHALLVRTSPPVATELGAKLLGYYQQVSLLESEMLGADLLGEGSAMEKPHSQKLAIGINADSLSTWCFDAIQPFIERHHLLLDLRVDDQDQTHRMLKNGEVIGCISALDRPLPGCHCELLGAMIYHCMCSPRFKARFFAKGVNRQAFKQAPAVRFDRNDQLQTAYLRRYWKVGAFDYPYHLVPASEPYVDFIARGMAWGMVPEIQVGKQLAAGELIELTPRKPFPVPLYWHVWNLKSRLLRELSEALRSVAKGLH